MQLAQDTLPFASFAGFGLDGDWSVVQLQEVYTDQRVDGDPKAGGVNVSSSLGVISLRPVTGLSYSIGLFSIDSGLTFQLPLTEVGKSVDASDSTDPDSETDAGASAPAWQKVLAHRSNIGAEFSLGLTLLL